MQLFDFEEVKYLERDTNTPTLSGTINSEIGKGGTVVITIGDKTYTTDINPQDGKWSWTPPEALNDGHYSLSIVVRDKAGNVSPPTLRTLIIDTTPPEAPQLLYIYDDQGKESGMIQPGDKTDDRRPTLTGVAQKGTIVYLKDGDKIIGSATADAKTGVWTIEPEQDLSDGPHRLTLVAKETFAGKERWGEETQAIDIIIGNDGPGVPVIDGVMDDVGTLTGNISNGGVTDDKRPTLTGTADANSIVTLFVDGKAAGSVRADSTGRWSLTPLADLADGLHKLTVTASDDNGNSSIETAGWDIIVDTVIDTPAIISLFDNFGANKGEVANGGKTDDATPTLSGEAEAGSLVTIYDGTTVLGSVTTDSTGKWTFTPTSSLASGRHSFNVIAIDQAGNQSGRSTNWSVDIAPDLTTGSENWESQSNRTFGLGVYNFSSGLKVQFLNLGDIHPNELMDTYNYVKSRMISLATKSDVNFIFGETKNVSFDYCGVNALKGGKVQFYSPEGKLLGEFDMVRTATISGSRIIADQFRHISFKAPGDETIGYMKILTTDYHNMTQSPILIDNIKWGNNVANTNVSDEIYNDPEPITHLSLSDVLVWEEKALFIDNDMEQIVVDVHHGDKLTLSDVLKDGTDLGDWNQVPGAVTIAGEQYNVYQHSGSDVEVLVQMGVQVELQNH